MGYCIFFNKLEAAAILLLNTNKRDEKKGNFPKERTCSESHKDVEKVNENANKKYFKRGHVCLIS